MGSYDLSKIRVLIVEDSSFMVSLLYSILQAFNITRIRQARNRKRFTSLFNNFRPDLVLTDWEVPGFGGNEVAEIVRQGGRDGRQFTPIIAISGHAEIEAIREMLKSGVDDVMVKPISSEDLHLRICRLITNPPDYVTEDNYLGPERNLKHLLGEKVID